MSSIDYNDYVGRIGVGRIERGVIHVGDEVLVCDYHDPSLQRKEKVSALYQFTDVHKEACEQATVGDIVAVSGIGEVTIGNTLCDKDVSEPLPFVRISEPIRDIQTA